MRERTSANKPPKRPHLVKRRAEIESLLCQPPLQTDLINLLPSPDLRVESQREDIVFYLTVYFEARGESSEGQKMVAAVILNRWMQQSWYGKSIREVCLYRAEHSKYYQFSCWNDETRRSAPGKNLDVRIYLDIVKWIKPYYEGKIPPIDTKVDHYYNPHVVNADWSTDLEFITSIGNHRFHSTGRVPQFHYGQPDLSRILS